MAKIYLTIIYFFLQQMLLHHLRVLVFILKNVVCYLFRDLLNIIISVDFNVNFNFIIIIVIMINLMLEFDCLIINFEYKDDVPVVFFKVFIILIVFLSNLFDYFYYFLVFYFTRYHRFIICHYQN